MVGFAPWGPKRQVHIWSAQMITLLLTFVNFQLTADLTATVKPPTMAAWISGPTKFFQMELQEIKDNMFMKPKPCAKLLSC